MSVVRGPITNVVVTSMPSGLVCRYIDKTLNQHMTTNPKVIRNVVFSDLLLKNLMCEMEKKRLNQKEEEKNTLNLFFRYLKLFDQELFLI